MKIMDVTVKRYSASRQPRTDPGGIQIVEVHTDSGVTGMGFVSAGSATSDLVATLIRRNLKAVVAGEDPLLTDDLWRRMHEQAVPRRGGEGLVRTCIAAVDFALWDIKAKLLNAPLSALFGGRRPRVATYANCAHHFPPDKHPGILDRGLLSRRASRSTARPTPTAIATWCMSPVQPRRSRSRRSLMSHWRAARSSPSRRPLVAAPRATPWPTARLGRAGAGCSTG